MNMLQIKLAKYEYNKQANSKTKKVVLTTSPSENYTQIEAMAIVDKTVKLKRLMFVSFNNKKVR